jgi:hypothetical protein
MLDAYEKVLYWVIAYACAGRGQGVRRDSRRDHRLVGIPWPTNDFLHQRTLLNFRQRDAGST